MTFLRLNRGDVIAFVAALCVLLVLPMTWYTTQQGEQLRHEVGQFTPEVNSQETPSPSQQAAQAAAAQEKNAWRADAPVDRLLLVAVLSAVALALAAAFARAAGRRARGPVTLSQVASFAGLAAVALIFFRILDPPGLHVAAVLKSGPPLALACMGALTIGARIAVRAERDAPAPAQPGPAPAQPGPAPAEPDAEASSSPA